MKRKSILSLLIFAVVITLPITSAFSQQPPLIYWGNYYIYNDGIPVAKIQEKVYRFTEDEWLNNPNVYSEWQYTYNLNWESGIGIYSLHINDAHPTVMVTSNPTWSYNGSINGYHTWSTINNPLNWGNNSLNNFSLWIWDIYGNPNDGDHGYVPWDVNDVNGNWIAETNGYVVENVSAPVPEPGTLLLLGSGLIGFGVIARYRRNKK